MVNFPTGPELRQGDQLKNIQDQNTTNNNNNKTNNNNDNNDLVICDKLQSFDNVLSDTWIDKKITDEQVMFLGEQINELIVEAECIN